MVTRVLFSLVLMVGLAAGASAQEPKIVALGITDHAVTEDELKTGDQLPVPRFNSPAVAYGLAANLKQGDAVEIKLNNGNKPLMRNTETLSADKASHLLLVGKQGVPAGGWPEGTYTATLKITRDGKELIGETTKPIAFE